MLFFAARLLNRDFALQTTNPDKQDSVQYPLEGCKCLGYKCNSTIPNTFPVFLFCNTFFTTFFTE